MVLIRFKYLCALFCRLQFHFNICCSWNVYGTLDGLYASGYLLNVPRAGAPVDFDITSQWTLAVGLFRFINDATKLNYSAFAAGALIVGLPITVLYMFFQKYLIEGIYGRGYKG